MSCRILQSWTARPPVLSVFVRHGLLPMFEGTYKRAPLHRDHPGTSDMGTAWCHLRKIVPEVYILLLALLYFCGNHLTIVIINVKLKGRIL